MRREKAIWWRRTGQDEYGASVFDDPVEIKCRWVERADQMVGKQGEIEVSKAKVYVDREMNEGDILKYGPIQSDTATNPREEADAFEIKAFERTPDFTAREFLYAARL